MHGLNVLLLRLADAEGVALTAVGEEGSREGDVGEQTGGSEDTSHGK